MNTKFVYAVVSDVSDIYLEQTYVSILSLRKHNKDAFVVLVIDDSTDYTLKQNRSQIVDVINEKIVVTPPTHYSKVQRSRYLKTSLRKYISGDYLFIDSDTVITDDLSDIESYSGDVLAVLDKHILFNEHPGYYEVVNQCNKIGWEIEKSDQHYYNSGVMLVRDSHISHLLYERWNEEWKKQLIFNMHSDQPALGKANEEMGYIIKELDGIWNCQISDNGLKYLHEAKIIHYFSSTIKSSNSEYLYYFMDKKVFAELKTKGFINNELQNNINFPQSAFCNRTIVLSGNERQFYLSALVRNLKILYFEHYSIYKALNSFFHYKRLFLNKLKKCIYTIKS